MNTKVLSHQVAISHILPCVYTINLDYWKQERSWEGSPVGTPYEENSIPFMTMSLLSTKNPVDNMLLPTWKSHHCLILGDTLSFILILLIWVEGQSMKMEQTTPLQTFYGRKRHGHRISNKKHLDTNHSPHKFLKAQLTFMISKNINNI